jgi:hypothetical protein
MVPLEGFTGAFGVFVILAILFGDIGAFLVHFFWILTDYLMGRHRRWRSCVGIMPKAPW